MFWKQYHFWRSYLRLSPQCDAFSRALCAGFVALLIWTNGCKAAEQPSINVTRSGNGVAISAAAIIRAPVSLIWETLTDYNHLASFIPGMTKSRIIARHGTIATVEQDGTASILAFSYPIHVTVEADEHRPTMINLRMLNGNFRQFSGIYRIDKMEDGIFTLSWAGIVEPEIVLPPDVSAFLLRSNIADQFLGMVREIERREAVRLNH